MNKGKLLIISGPSGVGKSTVISKLMNQNPGKFTFSVSATTRSPRTGETEGVDYFFVSKEQFIEMIKNGELLEHAEFVGNYYGTPKAQVENQLENGLNVILDIEVQGAANVKEMMPQAVSVFLSPPSLKDLEIRLRARGTDSEEVIQNRLASAESQMSQANTYDYIVYNRDPQEAANEIEKIIFCE